MTPTVILAALRQGGFTVRLKKGKLLVSPLSKLSDEQRRLIKENRDGLLEALTAEAKQDATNDAVCAVKPPGFSEGECVILEHHEIVRCVDHDGSEELLATPVGWLTELREFAAAKRREAMEKKDKEDKKRRKRAGVGEEAFFDEKPPLENV